MQKICHLKSFVIVTVISAICLQWSALRAQEPSPLQIPDRLGQADSLFPNPGNFDLKPFAALEVPGGKSDNVKPGDEVTLTITLLLPPKSYTYSTNPSFDAGTRINLTKTAGLEPIDEDFKTNRPPKIVLEKLLSDKPVEKLHEDVVWSRRFRIKKEAKLSDVSITGSIRYQVCDDSTCKRLDEEFRATLISTGSAKVASNNQKKLPFELEITPERIAGKPEPIIFQFQLAPENAKPGEEVTLSIVAKPEKEWHIFALSQDPKMAGKPTVIDLASLYGLKPIGDGFKPGKTPEVEKPLEDIVQHVHYDEITWTRKYTVLDSAAKDGYGLEGILRYQICREGTCRIPTKVPFELGTILATNEQITKNTTTPVTADENEADGAAPQGLVLFMVTAFLAGFTALLTPCVFPMIPITVSFFLKQSEKEHHKPISMALTYCGGIIGGFTVLGVLIAAIYGATALTTLANGPWFNLAIAGVLIFFGMNLLGMFEIRIPSGLLTWSSTKEGQGGFVGVLFMALTFTLVSFTCTFAFVGGLLVYASNGEYYWPILGMLGFSTAFSLPFFFLALFPSYLHKLPKSGGWMNTVKVTMGMIEVGAAFKFLSVSDLSWFPEAFLFDYSLVMSAWIVISVCTGLYLLGLFRLPHDTPAEHISAIRLIFAMSFLGLASYLAVGLFAPEKPSGKIWDNIAAFAPPIFVGGNSDIGPYLEHDGLQYALDYERAYKVAVNENQPVFIDFTGVNCINCRKMEKVMEKPKLRKRLEKFVRVQVYTDSVPTIPNELEEKMLEKNLKLQTEWFGDVSLPAYVIVTPKGKILAKVTGLQSEDVFAEFLDEGFEKWGAKEPDLSKTQPVVHE